MSRVAVLGVGAIGGAFGVRLGAGRGIPTPLTGAVHALLCAVNAEGGAA